MKKAEEKIEENESQSETSHLEEAVVESESAKAEVDDGISATNEESELVEVSNDTKSEANDQVADVEKTEEVEGGQSMEVEEPKPET